LLGIEWAPLAGAIVGFVVGLTGVGGGALMAPILLTLFGFDLMTVVATDLLFATITKLVASHSHNKNALVDWQIVKRLWLGSIPATLIVVFLAHKGALFTNESWITYLLGSLVIFSGAAMLFGSNIQLFQRARRIKKPQIFKKSQPPLTITAGAILGGMVSATSIGAGALGAIFLIGLYPLRMKPAKLVATDTMHAIPVSLIGGLGYLAMGATDIKLLGLLLLGSIPSALLASRLITATPPVLIKNFLGLLLLLIGAKLLALT